MIELLRNTLKALKERAERNLEAIYQNNRIVEAMLEESLSEERSEKIEKLYADNKQLMKENSESIQLQYEITKFIENHLRVSESDKREALGRYKTEPRAETGKDKKDEILRMTIRGEIPFNEKHPFYDDEEFFSKLLEHYKNAEQYETCQVLLKKRQKSRKD